MTVIEIEGIKSNLRPYNEETVLEDYNYNLGYLNGYINGLLYTGNITSIEKDSLIANINEMFNLNLDRG